MDAETCAAVAASMSESLVPGAADVQATRAERRTRVLPVTKSGIAIGVVFDMVPKPASIAVALGIVVLGGVVGFILVARQAPLRAAAGGAAGDQALMTP